MPELIALILEWPPRTCCKMTIATCLTADLVRTRPTLPVRRRGKVAAGVIAPIL